MPFLGRSKPVERPCPKCGMKLVTWNLEGSEGAWCKNRNCRYTSTRHLDPSKFMNLFICRVLRNNKVAGPGYGVSKINKIDLSILFPADKRGETVLDLSYDPSGMIRGDLVFVAEKWGKIQYYKNLRLGTEHQPLIGSWDTAIKALEGGQMAYFFEIIRPYSQIGKTVSEKVIEKWSQASKELHETNVVQSATGPEFEKAVAQLLTKMNVQGVTVVGGASDKGVDIEGYLDDQRIVIQCKHQHPLNQVKPTQVRDFAHVLEREKVKGYLITSSTFSPECFLKENCGESMELIDHSRLVELEKTYGVPDLEKLLR